MIDGFDKMLAGSLRLEEQWYIEGANFDPDNHEIHIHVGGRKKASFVCPVCGAATKRYGYETEERIWRHADCLFYPCYVHCGRPKVLCDKCGVVQLDAPFERKNSRFTLMFEGYAMLIMADIPRAKAAKLLRCNEKSLESILSYWVDDAVGKADLSGVSSIAIDETAFKRGHEYVTIAIDADERRVFDVEEGRDKEAVNGVAAKLARQGGDPANIKAATSDMSASFLPAIKENFPEATGRGQVPCQAAGLESHGRGAQAGAAGSFRQEGAVQVPPVVRGPFQQDERRAEGAGRKPLQDVPEDGKGVPHRAGF